LKKAPLPAKLKATAAAGFTGVELWLEDLIGWRAGEVRHLLNDHGLTAVSLEKIAGWFEIDGDLMGVGDQDIEDECKKRLSLAAHIGIPYVIAVPSFSHRGRSATLAQGVDRFRRLLKIGRQEGATPTIEFMGQTAQINTAERCVEFLNLVGAGRMVVDAYHLWKGGSIQDFTLVGKDQISLLHISDADPLVAKKDHRDRDRVAPGSGIIDLKRFITIAKDMEYFGPISVGVYNPVWWDRDPESVAKIHYESLGELL